MDKQIYYDDYETENVDGDCRCKFCELPVSQINGKLDGHKRWCDYRNQKEKELDELNTIKTDIREYNEQMTVCILNDDDGRLTIFALNEGGCCGTRVDLVDVIEWVKVNKPELL